ncbi:MAG: FKBP-type peptidyl-prolyl cis-trans isomerase [Proteobacteria bacterium]|nr:FKBP-type peptidyl-prolyl cis-trans isomerase [Pseudomonadota bacterium]
MTKEFFELNAEKEDVITLASGLQYRIIEQGKGRFPSEKDKVKVHYRGTLENGKEFDSSYKKGKPSVFRVDSVIRGWSEALQLMQKGSKWEIFVPPNLGYGKRGISNFIPPNSILIFEVELLKTKVSFLGF